MHFHLHYKFLITNQARFEHDSFFLLEAVVPFCKVLCISGQLSSGVRDIGCNHTWYLQGCGVLVCSTEHSTTVHCTVSLCACACKHCLVTNPIKGDCGYPYLCKVSGQLIWKAQYRCPSYELLSDNYMWLIRELLLFKDFPTCLLPSTVKSVS